MTEKPNNTCVWFEIACSDLEASQKFYEQTLGITMHRNDDGPNPMIAFSSMDDPGVSGHLYPGKPAASGTGNSIHLAVKGKLEDAMARVPNAGGTVVSDIIPIPFGRFVYCEDPDGNSIGLFEAAES
ncbi:MAG: VOC family protein [Ahrensia sp.]|nr:VOC family protein [Ahrensia sp.]